MNNVNDFNVSLANFASNKTAQDYQLQQLAEFSINQSIEHSNADCGMRLIATMRQVKQGHIRAMVGYLCKNGNFSVNEAKQTLQFERIEGREVVEGSAKAEWMEGVKTERIVQPKDDAYVIEQVQNIIKQAKAWAKLHPEKAVSDATLNSLTALLPSAIDPVTAA